MLCTTDEPEEEGEEDVVSPAVEDEELPVDDSLEELLEELFEEIVEELLEELAVLELPEVDVLVP